MQMTDSNSRTALATCRLRLVNLLVGQVFAIVSLFTGQLAFAVVSPIVLYTDVVSGPTSGGENGKGVYLSIFGKNFGSAGLGMTLKVFINDVEVDNYRYLGASRGRADIQQITVQVGAIGNPALRVPLPIKVVVNGLQSNTNHTFTVNPGNIYFVDPNLGNDNTGSGTIANPFKTVQKPAGVTTTFLITSAATGGVWGILRAGDVVVLRGGIYNDIGFGGTNANGLGYFLQTLNKSGCPIGTNCTQGGGTSSGPITIVGYPTETAFIDRTNAQADKDNNFGGGISSADSARQGAGYGAWFTIANLKIESGFTDGPINTQKGEDNTSLGSNWRVVNNELTAFSCAQSTLCRAGAIAGSGVGNVWLGNYGHDIYDKPDANTSLENHGVYIGGAGTFEIAYNVFENILGGNGIQVQSFFGTVANLRIHHNLIRNIGKHGLNFTDGTGVNVAVWNNLIYDTDSAGVRFKDDNTRNLKLYNNTFYNTGRLGNMASGASLVNDTNAPTPAAIMFDIRNNIFWANATAGYNSGCCNSDFSGSVATFGNNLWFNAGAAPSFDVNSVSANPNFVSASTDFRLNSASPAIDVGSDAVSSLVIDDYDIATTSVSQMLRPLYGRYDIGAFEASPAQCRLDLDGDGRVLATTDATMISRIVRVPAAALNATIASGIGVAPGATRTAWTTAIRPYLAASSLDIDGDGVGTVVDALLLLRASLGFRDDAAISGIAFAANATRKRWADIRSYLVNECAMAIVP
jgi:hypothetical protein